MLHLRAKYLVIDPVTIIENGVVAVEGSVVKYAGSASHCLPGGQTKDLGDSIITPGLINPHTHLEGPELYGGTPPPDVARIKPPQSFINWAQKVIAVRKQLSPDYLVQAVTNGYNTCIRNGITTIADHTHLARVGQTHLNKPIRRFLVEEAVNLDKTTADDTLKQIKTNINVPEGIRDEPPDVTSGRGNLINIGLAPHSVYSVSDKLYQQLFALAGNKGLIFSTHLSELKEEVEFIKTGKGRLLGYLKKIGRYPPERPGRAGTDNWKAPGVSPVQYLHKLGILKPPAFFVHCNYLSTGDIKLLSASGASVVFCPNSHHYFGHRHHPFMKLLKAGVNVALGTDGLGSNSDLSILKEMRFVYNPRGGLNPSQIFKLGTLNGAKTLNLHNRIGALNPYYQADIVAFPIKGRRLSSTKQVLPYLIETAPQCNFMMVAGRVIRDT
ncbi:MAG: amidohydrolase family protein [Planctomycetes bacterium]|nr:amidohydrolase family protein [Planctomycetota bacterium]